MRRLRLGLPKQHSSAAGLCCTSTAAAGGDPPGRHRHRRCSGCSLSLPALPQQLYWYSKGQLHDKAKAHNLADCIECGACAWVRAGIGTGAAADAAFLFLLLPHFGWGRGEQAVGDFHYVWARLGTPVRHLLEQAEFCPASDQMVIMGGPLMGFGTGAAADAAFLFLLLPHFGWGRGEQAVGDFHYRNGTPVRHLLEQAEFCPASDQMVIMGGPLMGFTLPSLPAPPPFRLGKGRAGSW
jgi:NAD-dependent dihydropyrimidine dehydrogenase PreA subunit